MDFKTLSNIGIIIAKTMFNGNADAANRDS